MKLFKVIIMLLVLSESVFANWSGDEYSIEFPHSEMITFSGAGGNFDSNASVLETVNGNWKGSNFDVNVCVFCLDPAVNRLAQKFSLITSYNTDKISLPLRKTGNPGNLNIRIVNDSSGSPGVDVVGGLSAQLSASTVTGVYAYNQITFASEGTLVKDTNYWLIAENPITQLDVSYYEWDGNLGYSKGNANYFNENWFADNNSDYAFLINFGSAQVQSKPIIGWPNNIAFVTTQTSDSNGNIRLFVSRDCGANFQAVELSLLALDRDPDIYTYQGGGNRWDHTANGCIVLKASIDGNAQLHGWGTRWQNTNN